MESLHCHLAQITPPYLPGGANMHTHKHPFNGPFSGTTRVSRYQKGKTNLDFTEARDSEWQWHQLGHMQVCTLLQTDNHTSTPPLSVLQAGCPSCRPTNSIKALKALRCQHANPSNSWDMRVFSRMASQSVHLLWQHSLMCPIHTDREHRPCAMSRRL